MKDFDDKDLVIVCATIIMIIAMFSINQTEVVELIKLGLTGLMGIAVGRGTSK